MKFKEFKHEPVQPDTYEASMALNQLMRIGKHAIKLHNMIDDAAEMESWVAKKIDLAGDYVKKVYNYTEGEKAGLYDDGGMTESREQIGDYAREIKTGRIVRIVDYTDDDEGIYTISYGEDKGENDVTAKDLKFLDQTGGDQEEISKFEDKGSTMASRVIRNYAREIGADSMDYDMFVKSADLLDKEMLKSLAQHIENSDTAPREYVMKKIADHDPETFRKMYGDQEGYLSIMKPRKDLTDDESVSEDAGEDEKIVDMLRNIKQHLDNHPNMSEHPSLVALDQLADDLESGDKPADYESVSEDAGEGHMSKSTLYHTAKYAIELMQMINKGDDLEGWVQSKLNKAADYLQGVYNYEEYQKLNPYREELDPNILQKHAGIVQKNIDEILARETKLDDIDTKPGMMKILAKRVNEVEKEIAKETRKETNESGILYRAGVKKYGKAGMKAIQSAAAKGANHEELGKIKDKHLKDDEQIEEGLKDFVKKLAMAGVIVAGLAGVNSINDAIDNSVPAVKAMNSALEMAQDSGNTELAKMIEKDLSAVKVRLSSGKDLNFVKNMQDKYIKFMPTEGMAYESKLAVQLNQQLK